jgi:arylsulfatase A-like enzyme
MIIFNRILVSGLFLVVFGLTTAFAQTSQKKNVLFIISDDLNCNESMYDHYMVKTPNIDKLAKKGMLFTNAYCNFPLCGPSRGSMMTGLYPDQTGHHKLRDLIRDHVPNVVTMSQSFMRQGYEATRVGKIFHYDNPKGIGTPGHDDSLSWNHRYYPKGRDRIEEDKIFTLEPGQFGATLSWFAADGTDEEQTDGMVATQSIELLERYARDKTSFFLAVGFYKPHTPYVAPKKYFDMYPKEKIRIPPVPDNYLSTLPEPARQSLTRLKSQNNLSDSLALCAIQAYYATITFMDAQVGRVLEALEKNGLAENTIIVFTSDHGYHMGEHAYYQKLTLFENANQIPLIIHVPGMKNKGTKTSSMAEMIDLYPTLTDLCEVSSPAYLAGKSLKPILLDPKTSVRESALSQIVGGYTLRTKDFRYTRWGEVGKGMTELYDRRSDPEELKNLSENSKYVSTMKRLDQQLTDRIKAANVPPVGLRVVKGTD